MKKRISEAQYQAQCDRADKIRQDINELSDQALLAFADKVFADAFDTPAEYIERVAYDFAQEDEQF